MWDGGVVGLEVVGKKAREDCTNNEDEDEEMFVERKPLLG